MNKIFVHPKSRVLPPRYVLNLVFHLSKIVEKISEKFFNILISATLDQS